MKSLQNWMWGVLFALVLGAFAYAASIDASIERRAVNSEGRVIERIDNLDTKIQWIMQHLIDSGKR
jgi:hypothetical protein